jgi:hypothetical protein
MKNKKIPMPLSAFLLMLSGLLIILGFSVYGLIDTFNRLNILRNGGGDFMSIGTGILLYFGVFASSILSAGALILIALLTINKFTGRCEFISFAILIASCLPLISGLYSLLVVIKRLFTEGRLLWDEVSLIGIFIIMPLLMIPGSLLYFDFKKKYLKKQSVETAGSNNLN